MEMPSLEKITAAADKLTAHSAKPKKRRHKKSTRKSAKRVKAAKKAARKRVPSLTVLSKRHKTLLDRKFALDRRYAVEHKITRKQYARAFGPLVRALKKTESALRRGQFNL